MQAYWMRNMWALIVLCVLGIIAFLFSGVVPFGGQGDATAGYEAVTIARSYSAFDSNDLDGAIAAADELLARDAHNIEALLAKAAALAQKGSLEFKEKIRPASDRRGAAGTHARSEQRRGMAAYRLRQRDHAELCRRARRVWPVDSA